MPKQFQFRDDAWSQLMKGIDILSKAVGITLGPQGRNVVLGKDFGPPQVCSDGVTIAKEIELAEPFQNMGVQLIKEAASKTNDMVVAGVAIADVGIDRYLGKPRGSSRYADKVYGSPATLASNVV